MDDSYKKYYPIPARDIWDSALLGLFKDAVNSNTQGVVDFWKKDSPIEDIFCHNIVKYLHPESRIHLQYEIQIPFNFRLDFVIEHEDKFIGIECDGKDFHDYSRDKLRDFLILNQNDIKEIVRFSGSAIHNCVNNCIYFLSYWYPEFFNEEKVINLQTLADDYFVDLLQYNPRYSKDDEYNYFREVFFFYEHEQREKTTISNPVSFEIYRRKKINVEFNETKMAAVYSFIANNPNSTFEQLANAFPDF